ncbi:MAG: hypothetical protein ABL998_22230 [Planctomycetota bacterium]
MDLILPWVVGAGLAVGVSVFARAVGLDRDRAFYPTLLIVIAMLYDLFAVLGGSTRALLVELALSSVFIATAALGFRRNLWIVAVGLVGHGVMDFFHGHLVENPGVPTWWPAFCGSYDVVAGVLLAWLLKRSAIEPE